MLLDITVTVVQDNLAGSSEKTGFAASAKEKEKSEKYLLKSNNLGHLFWLIAIEVFGRWEKRAEDLGVEGDIIVTPPVLNMLCDQFQENPGNSVGSNSDITSDKGGREEGGREEGGGGGRREGGGREEGGRREGGRREGGRREGGGREGGRREIIN